MIVARTLGTWFMSVFPLAGGSSDRSETERIGLRLGDMHLASASCPPWPKQSRSSGAAPTNPNLDRENYAMISDTGNSVTFET